MQKEEEKYINPLTDFGFKKLFGTELNKDLLIDFLNELLPNRKIKDLTYSTNEHFGQYEIDRKAVFEVAEIAGFTEEERKEYEESLKTYRDIKNVVDTAKAEGKIEGKIEEKEGVVERCWRKGMEIEDIAEISELTVKQVEAIIRKIKKNEK